MDVTRQWMLVTETQDETQFGTGQPQTDAEFRRLSMRLGFDPPLAQRYRFERTAGIGAMGAVHVAFDTQLERRVAVKQVRSNRLSPSSNLPQRLAREAQALARINHPNVVTIHDVGEEQGELYVAMEYVPGVTLGAWQTRERRTTWEIIDAYIQAGRGLAAAHGCGVVHRDFKPENVIFGNDGVVRVVDFGIATAVVPEGLAPTRELVGGQRELGNDQPDTRERQQLTAAGSIMGTLPYMSPEQLSGEAVDTRSDQFSFCVALWEAVSGVRPFGGQSPGQRLRAMHEPLVGASKLPRWLRVILSRGLRYDPNARHHDMDALLDALQGRRRKLRIARLTLGSALALGSCVAVGWWLAPSATPPAVESCASFQAQLDSRWDAARRTSLHSRLATLDADAASFVIDELDRLAGQWTEAAAASCIDEVAPSLDSRARACLTSYLDTFERSVDVLTRVERDAVARAPDLLGRLSAPGGDYCSISPNAALDPKVTQLARGAREAAVLGEFARAHELADAARKAAAPEKGQPHRYTLEFAEAHLAAGEAFAFAGEFESALVELTEAQAHAYGDDQLSLEVALMRVKAISLSEGELAVGRTLLELFDPLATKLGLSDVDPRRGEIEEARGLLARAEHACDRAIAHHERARAIFVAAGRPIDAAKALLNIGACRHDDSPKLAAQAYAEALALFQAAGVPPSYRNRVELEFNLGVLAFEAGDPSGLAHFESVILHGSRRSALEAIHLAINLAYDAGDESQADEWARRGLERLAATPEGPADLSVEIRLVVGMILAERELEGGLELMFEAERDAAGLDIELRDRVLRNRILWSQQRGRCDEMRDKLAELTALEAEAGADLGVMQWQTELAPDTCAPQDQMPTN